MQGGMHKVLNDILTYLDKQKTTSFTAKEITELTGLCHQSVINNISRLVNAGYLLRHEYRKRGKIVYYTFNPDVIDFIKEFIENDENNMG